MARPIEKTLAMLHDAMAAHRTALAQEPAPPVFNFAPPADRRAQLALRLLVGAEARAGIEVSQPTMEKLLRALDSIELADLEAWVARLDALSASHPEWLSLIENLTVHETYIMRDPSQLEFLAAQLPSLIAEAAARSHHLRFWSVGCATGEEAYSVAALVLDALVASGNAIESGEGTRVLPPWQIEVVGSDISRRVLTPARTGIYETGPLSSFRTESAAVLRHFPSNKAPGPRAPISRSASAELKEMVRFEQFNIMGDLWPSESFDAVLCRNVLIYFSTRARRLAQKKLKSIVRSGGFLLLGPTDTLIDSTGFETLWAPNAVIYRRSDAHV